MSEIQVHVHVSGKVQGVSYRAYATAEARRLGLKGWVRNLGDGRVEAVFQGPREAVDAMVAWCRQGSAAAVVDAVQVQVEEVGEFEGFAVR